MNSKIRVGVLRGGPSSEYEVSLKTGARVLDVLLNHLSHKFKAVDVFIDRTGVWHMNGRVISPETIGTHVDVVWNGLHGTYGEDGAVQALLDTLAIPYTGSNAEASSLGMDKRRAKDTLRDTGIRTPVDIVISDYRKQDLPKDVYMTNKVGEVFLAMPAPWVVKPLSGGSSIGVSVARSQDQLFDALMRTSDARGDIMVEQFVYGREATVTTMDNFRGEEVYSFLPIEIRIPQGRFFDYELKYGDDTSHEISPGRFTHVERTLLESTAKKIHRALGVRHYARMDFMLTPRGVYFIEINTLPGLTESSLVPKSLASVGTSFYQFVEHVLDQVLMDRK